MAPTLPAIVVHGGAGDFADERIEAVRAGCERAARAGMAVLAGGGAALDAAQAAVRALEEDPEFNAGVGAVLTRDGAVEIDAALMDGATLRFGAVAAMENARHGIDIARALLEDGEHALLCGEGAWRFARERGFSPSPPAELITPRARARLDAAEAGRRTVAERDPGTVGACAIDAAGHVAAATSTGGMTYKRAGRIGDTPLAGCGTYADDRGGAASATGEGEAIIRVTMARVCTAAMESGMEAAEAARRAVDDLAGRVGGRGGIICCDHAGHVAAAHNSPRMAFAAAHLDAGRVVTASGVALRRDEELEALLAGAG